MKPNGHSRPPSASRHGLRRQVLAVIVVVTLILATVLSVVIGATSRRTTPTTEPGVVAAQLMNGLR